MYKLDSVEQILHRGVRGMGGYQNTSGGKILWLLQFQKWENHTKLIPIKGWHCKTAVLTLTLTKNPSGNYFFV